jgi:hypothetical protein
MLERPFDSPTSTRLPSSSSRNGLRDPNAEKASHENYSPANGRSASKKVKCHDRTNMTEIAKRGLTERFHFL